MKRMFGLKLRAAAGALAVMAVVAGLFAFTASPSAAQEEEARARPDRVAVAIGQLNEADGGKAWLSLQAGALADKAHGNFRYYYDEAGYYNGAVRILRVSDGAIHVEGGGGLHRPDGTKQRVRFTLDISADGERVELSIVGRKYSYEMTGSLDGFAYGGAPPIRVNE